MSIEIKYDFTDVSRAQRTEKFVRAAENEIKEIAEKISSDERIADKPVIVVIRPLINLGQYSLRFYAHIADKEHLGSFFFPVTVTSEFISDALTTDYIVYDFFNRLREVEAMDMSEL